MVDPAETAKARGLTEQQFGVLQHVSTFRITTSEVVHRLFFQDQTLEAAKSALKRLRGRGFLGSAHLTSTGHYFFLTPRGYGLLGEPTRRVGALSPQPLAEAYGILQFCAAKAGRAKLTRAAFEQAFPQLVKQGLPRQNFYLDDEDRARRLGVIYVDRGADAARIMRKLDHKHVGRYAAFTEWREQVIDAGRLTISVVTPTPEKASRLAQLLEDRMHGRWHSITFRFEATEALLPILDRRP